MPDGQDILKTLIKLLEDQEHIKVTYTVKKRGVDDKTISTSKKSA